MKVAIEKSCCSSFTGNRGHLPNFRKLKCHSCGYSAFLSKPVSYSIPYMLYIVSQYDLNSPCDFTTFCFSFPIYTSKSYLIPFHIYCISAFLVIPHSQQKLSHPAYIPWVIIHKLRSVLITGEYL